MTEYYYNHTDRGLCLTFPGLVWLGYSESYLKKASSVNSPSWPFIAHPEDGRKKLLPYKDLSAKRKGEITERLRKRMDCKHADEQHCHCGDLVYYASVEPIRNMLVKDDKAEAFFMGYRFTDTTGKPASLPTEKVKHYTNEAGILNFVTAADGDIKGIVKGKLGFKSVTDFWDKLIEIVKQEKMRGNVGGKFPTSYTRLVAHKTSALKTYKSTGYKGLIHGNYGKGNAAKVNDDLSAEQLKSFIEDGTQRDDVLICMLYNTWAEQSGYNNISPATVGVWRKKCAHETDLGRYGKSAYNERFVREVKGVRPSNPLFLVEHDDNALDFLFEDDGYQFAKYVAYVVTDSFNDLVLGKSYIAGRDPMKEQIRHAYIDAMYYIRSLTGGWYMPFEIKSDQYAATYNKDFYASIARRIVPGFGNKHRGYIEQFFGSTHWKRSQQLISQDNWSGNNMTAKYRGVSDDMLEHGRKLHNIPTVGRDAEIQIENFFTLLRRMPAFTRQNMNAPSKEQAWLERWNQMSEDDKRPITDDVFLQKFGILHQPKHTDGIRISNRGVEPQILGQKWSFDLPESWMYSRLNGALVQLYFDPYDMSRILCTNNDDIRFVATTAQFTPRALRDAYTDSRTYLNAILGDKAKQWDGAYSAQEQRKKVANGYVGAEALLQGGALIKELKNSAEGILLTGGRAEEDNAGVNPLDLM